MHPFTIPYKGESIKVTAELDEKNKKILIRCTSSTLNCSQADLP
jgi:hypothetical protein